MTNHVSDAQIYIPDPAAPTKRSVQPFVAGAANAVIYGQRPNVSQPFRYANGCEYTDVTVGDRY